MADTPAVKRNHGRRSVTENLALQNCFTTQDVIWISIRNLKGSWFTRKQLCSQLVKDKVRRANDDTVLSYLQRLTRGGYLQTRTAEGGQRANVQSTLEYYLLRDTGNEAPRLMKDGKPCTQGGTNDRMWRAIKMLKEFSYIELQAAASIDKTPVKAKTVKTYLGYLLKAKYIAVTKASKPGTPARYRHIPTKSTGPRAPMILRTHCVFDPNLQKVVWSQADE